MSTANAPPHHDSHVAHHFTDSEHQYSTSLQGVWVFLLTEVLMFGGLFVAYSIFHQMYPNIFAEGKKFLDWKLGALNTVVLITSSVTMALAIFYCQTNKKNKAVVHLAITIFCGLIFMVVKYFEYSHKIHEGLIPGSGFHYHGSAIAHLPLYFSFYFVMTGLHGIHVLTGMGLITWVMVRTWKGEFSSHYYTPVEGVGLFWHLVDLVWIYLFPLLYLMG